MAVGAMLVYDITQYKTFVSLTKYLSELKEHTTDDVVVVLVGNKSDLRHLRTVMTDEAAEFASAFPSRCS